jgi:hypothetical protein
MLKIDHRPKVGQRVVLRRPGEPETSDFLGSNFTALSLRGAQSGHFRRHGSCKSHFQAQQAP